MINAERIAEMKRLSAEATPGPWEVEESRYDGKYNAASVDENYDLPACLMRDNDAMLVTESRQFVPDIIAAYEETKKQSAFWYEQFVNMTDAHAEQAEELAKAEYLREQAVKDAVALHNENLKQASEIAKLREALSEVKTSCMVARHGNFDDLDVDIDAIEVIVDEAIK